MEKTKQQMDGSSSFTSDLFGPKDSLSPPSSNGLFGSVFGPPSTGLGKDSSHYGFMGSARKQDLGSPHSNDKNGNSGLTNSKEKRYHCETVEPCNFSSSIYYGGQEVYSPTTQQPTVSQHVFKKDGEDDDPNGSNLNSASRGNWWQGSLYY